VRYCPKHLQATRKADDARRGTPEQRGYDWTWRTKIRPAALAREPLCRFCSAEGLVQAGEEVDHIDGNSRNNDPDNLRVLCRRHHSQRTARDQAWGRKR
jgi:5-methylcytosine-specific restriction protein A